ncbi:MAG: efflux RND transporter periplasmic adaptor subunit [Nevskia sp.]|nr:efflux RND transporter periplasmic adaptor subunit [Nevskia sp.]
MTTPFRFGRRPLPIIAFSLGLGLALIGTPWLGLAHAHGGQIEVGEGAKGPVHLSAAQEQAIGLQRVAADFRPLDELLDLNGELQLLPGRQAEVSTRISGQVQAVYATLGDNVRTGQRLARVQSRLVGEPPPSVDIPAPMSGVIDAVSVSLGQSIEPSTVLFHLSDRSRLNFVARVYEEDLGKVHTGQTARVRLLSDPGRTYPGTVTLVGPTFDPATRTVDVWIGLPNPDGRLRPSLFGRASLVLRQNTAALAIPTAAIIEANGEKFVFVHEGDAYQRVEIATGTSDDTYTEVTDGLVPGDEVVTQGARELYTVWLTGGKPAAAED